MSSTKKTQKPSKTKAASDKGDRAKAAKSSSKTLKSRTKTVAKGHAKPRVAAGKARPTATSKASPRKTARAGKPRLAAARSGLSRATVKTTRATKAGKSARVTKAKKGTARVGAVKAKVKAVARASARTAKVHSSRPQTGKAAAKTAASSRKTSSAVRKPAARKAAVAKSVEKRPVKAVRPVRKAVVASPKAVVKKIIGEVRPAPITTVPVKQNEKGAISPVTQKTEKKIRPEASVGIVAAAPTVVPATVVPPVLVPSAAKVDVAPKAVPAVSAVRPVEAPAVAKPPERMIVKPAKPVGNRQGFKTSEFIVYPAHGVGQIVAIEEQEVAGFKLELFVISFIKDKMILKVPTPKVVSVGMRKLAEADGVKRALDTLTGRARIKRTMWSRRAQEYEAKINSGDLISIAEVVRDLYRSDAQPEQSYSERQLYEAALDRMAREVAAVQKLTETEALKVIDASLQKGPRRGKPGDVEEAEADDGDIEEAA